VRSKHSIVGGQALPFAKHNMQAVPAKLGGLVACMHHYTEIQYLANKQDLIMLSSIEVYTSVMLGFIYQLVF